MCMLFSVMSLGVADEAVTSAGETAAAVTDTAAKVDDGGWLGAPISFIEKSIEFIHEVSR